MSFNTNEMGNKTINCTEKEKFELTWHTKNLT